MRSSSMTLVECATTETTMRGGDGAGHRLYERGRLAEKNAERTVHRERAAIHRLSWRRRKQVAHLLVCTPFSFSHRACDVGPFQGGRPCRRAECERALGARPPGSCLRHLAVWRRQGAAAGQDILAALAGR